MAISQRFDEAFFMCDLRDAEYKCRLWKENLPRVTPFYAVKSNPDPLFTRVLFENGVKFDCSNQVSTIHRILFNNIDPI